jgi:hypothetical protein
MMNDEVSHQSPLERLEMVVKMATSSLASAANG